MKYVHVGLAQSKEMRDRVLKSSVGALTCVVSTLPQRIYVHQPVDEPGLRKEQRHLDSPGMTGVKVGHY